VSVEARLGRGALPGRSAPADRRLIDLLRGLPAGLEWAVLFRVEPIARVVGVAMTRAAFGLPYRLQGPGISHVALTSVGPLLGRDGALETYDGAALPASGDRSLADRFQELIAAVSPEADCVGLGETEPGSRVAMTVHFGPSGRGVAEAWFAVRPSCHDWELLPTVGVRSLGEPRAVGPDGPWHARFSYSLEAHLQAARLGGFSRTLNCNDFFLSQGSPGARLQAGLRQAGRDRLAAAHGAAYDIALAVAQDAGDTLMRGQDATSRQDYGDLVALGILLTGLRRLPNGPAWRFKRGLGAVGLVRQRLRDGEIDGGWPFQTGGVTTGIDSAFVLWGLRDFAAVEALERFREPSGGYAGDRTGVPGPSTVAASPRTRHWQAPDVATTALVRALRAEAGLAQTTPASWLEARFAHRGSPFVACPWLLDCLLAVSLSGDRSPAAARLRELLLADVLASRSDDGSFGHGHQRVLATASACLALEALGVRGRTLGLAQLALVDCLAGHEDKDTAVPFYASTRVDLDRPPPAWAYRALLHGRGVVAVAGELHWLIAYEDAAGAVTAGLVAHALARQGDLATADRLVAAHEPHGRYRCRSVAEYVSRHALPGVLAGVDGTVVAAVEFR
jgi:hypothetical protein